MRSKGPIVRMFVGAVPLDVHTGTLVLTCLEALAPGIRDGNYCWTGECGHCEVAYAVTRGPVRDAMACRLAAVDGLRVTRLSRHLETDLGR